MGSSTRPFRAIETHGIVTRAENQRRLASDPFGWSALYASTQHELPFEGYFAPVADQLLVLHRSGPARVERLDASRACSFVLPSGGMHLYPGGIPFNIRLMDELDTIHVYLRRTIIEEVAADVVLGDPVAVEIPPLIVEDDPLLKQMLEAVDLALRDGEQVAQIYIDALSRAIAAHLVSRYSGARQKQGVAVEGRLAEAVEYMHEHLSRSIKLPEIARVAGCSPSHLGRIFRNAFGISPHAYLIELRLQEARRRLERSQEPIVSIAFACGFAHQEHLTRSFRTRFGTTPGAWRRGHRH